MEKQPRETIASLQKKLLQQAEAMIGMAARLQTLEDMVAILLDNKNKQIQIINQQTEAINQIAEQVQANPQVWHLTTIAYSTVD